MAGAAGSGSAAARFVPDLFVCSLVRIQESNGLFLPVRLIGAESADSLLVDRVVRLVSGGDAGAYLGASGVCALSSLALAGVSTVSILAEGFSVSTASSTSVVASSSSSISLVFGAGALAGKRSLGLMEDRVSGFEK